MAQKYGNPNQPSPALEMGYPVGCRGTFGQAQPEGIGSLNAQQYRMAAPTIPNSPMAYQQQGFHGSYMPGYPQHQIGPQMQFGGQYPMGLSAGPQIGLPQLLESCHDGIFVQERIDPLETLRGCTVTDTFAVHPGRAHPKTTGATEVLTCKETSNSCARQCLGASCKSIEMKVFNNLSTSREAVLSLVRECTCTICCINQPELVVYYTENNANQVIGKVSQTWDLCSYSFHIKDANNAVRYTISTSCCQCALCCARSCCEQIEFQVWTGDREKQEVVFTRLKVTEIDERLLDNYTVPFPAKATWQDKALFLASVLMVDSMYFSRRAHKKED